jgi:two-component system chemotaxis response regulator CheB
VIRLLVVDDSPLMRRLLGEVFTPSEGFKVGFARNGIEALAQLATFQPDVITLDVNMPEMDGLACLDRIMVERPCPVVMVSSLTAEGADVTLEALSLGAVDFVPKPDGAISLKMDALAPLLIDKVRMAASARLRLSHRLAERVRLRTGDRPAAAAPPKPAPLLNRRSRSSIGSPPSGSASIGGAVVIGTSTGGPPALDALLGGLPEDFPWPVLVAQHMPASFTGPLARRLDKLCALTVMEVTRPTLLAAGHIYIGRGDADLILGARPSGLVVLPVPESADYRWHPSVDRLMDSAAAHIAASRLVGVLMTGMGDDGAAAMTRLRRSGGRTIAEAEETAIVWGMPGELVRQGGAEFVTPLDDIAGKLCDLVPVT